MFKMLVSTQTDSRSTSIKIYNQKCCVCGKIANKIGLRVIDTAVTCSSMCYALLAFLQGFVCGNALCCLVRSSQGRELDELITFCHSRHEKLTCGNLDTQKPVCTDIMTKVVPETDQESNQGEETLQISFDDEAKVCDADDLSRNTPPTPSTLSSACVNEQYQRKLSVTKRRKLVQPVSVSKTHTQVISTKKHKSKLDREIDVKTENETEKICDDTDSTVNSTESVVTFPGMSSESMLNNSRDMNETVPNNSNKKRVECGICSETFVETHLYVHMKAKHKSITSTSKQKEDMLFSCCECNKQFEKQAHLNKHLAKKHPSCEKFTKSCSICHKGFSNQTGLSVHMRHAHQTVSPKECDLCEKTFKSCKELSRHKLVDHKLRSHICHLCGKNFAYRHALKSHLDAHAGIKKHICEVCGEGFVRMTSLCGHRISAHSKSKSEEVIYKCEYCKTSVIDKGKVSTFSSKALLNKHLFEHHLAGPYAMKDSRKQLSMSEEQRCQQCQDSSSGQCPLHADTGSGKTFMHTCSHCHKTFSRAHYLKAHEKQHQEAKFSCDVCCKRFTYKCNLKAHCSTHSNHKPFQCSVCSKKFRLKFLLEDHQRTHNGDLLFKCYICGRGLTRIPNLKRHIRVMHPDVSHSPRV